MKKIKTFLLTLLMVFINVITVACSSVQVTPEFVFSKTPPSSVKLYSEIYFKSYIEDAEGATYALYVSYTDETTGEEVSEQKQTSLVFTFSQCTDYTFRIERTIGKQIDSLSCEIAVIPEAPKFSSAAPITLEKGESKKFSELYALSATYVTPSNLEKSVKFTSLDIEYAEKGIEDRTGIDITGLNSYTFDAEGVYTFTVRAENVSGSDTIEIVVNTYNKENRDKKAEISYDPVTKTVSWAALENATAYRVWVDENEAKDIGETSFSFSDSETYPDGEYVFNIEPVFGTVVYKNSTVTSTIGVGRVRKPLNVSKNLDTISWDIRYLVESYTITVNGKTKTLTADTLTYTLEKGKYSVNDEIVVEIYGTFDDESVTETAELRFCYGEVGSATLSRIDVTASGVATGVEYVEFDGFSGNTWFLTEWEGKNAPNYAFRAVQGYSEWDGTYTTKECPGFEGTDITPAGMLLTNSSETRHEMLVLHRGTKTNTTDRLYINDGYLGINNYKENKKYIQIVGYEIGGELEFHQAKITVYLFEVASDGTLTLLTKQEAVSNYSGHALAGSKAVLYGNIKSTVDPNDTKNNPESVTFTYARPADTIDKLLYGIADSYTSKAQLIELCQAVEPEPEPEMESELSETATLKRIEAEYGIAENVEFIEFDGLAGNTWFMTSWDGKNAPNYAVRAVQGYSEWDAKLAAATTTMEGYTGSFTPAGILCLNTTETTPYSMSCFRGTNTNMGSDVTKRGTSVSGTYANSDNTAALGMARYLPGTKYVQIFGYEILNAAGGAEDTRLTAYLFSILGTEVSLVKKVEGIGRYSAHALQGSKAVIYGNLNAALASNEADNPESVTFSYVSPAESLEKLLENVSENYMYKTQILELLESNG